MLLKLKDSIGTGANAYKLMCKLSWKLGDGVSESDEPSCSSVWSKKSVLRWIFLDL